MAGFTAEAIEALYAKLDTLKSGDLLVNVLKSPAPKGKLVNSASAFSENLATRPEVEVLLASL